MSHSSSHTPPFHHALLAGGLAGTTVDLSLFPLDTLKTRLQSSAGFFPSGGFSGIYRGVGSAVVGSAPGAALFFVTYEATKDYLPTTRRKPGEDGDSSSQGSGIWAGAATHMIAASLGEVAACAVRVPTEVVKQRAQAGHHAGSSMASLKAILALRQSHGFVAMWRGLYRGWGVTVFREVPFTVIQFPIWEALKAWSLKRGTKGQQAFAGDASSHARTVGPWESGLYGSLAGAVAAAATTPLDVLKTRVILSEGRVTVGQVFGNMVKTEGWRPFFAGITPRVTWISIGGAIFLGSYQWAINTVGSL